MGRYCFSIAGVELLLLVHTERAEHLSNFFLIHVLHVTMEATSFLRCCTPRHLEELRNTRPEL